MRQFSKYFKWALTAKVIWQEEKEKKNSGAQGGEKKIIGNFFYQCFRSLFYHSRRPYSFVLNRHFKTPPNVFQDKASN